MMTKMLLQASTNGRSFNLPKNETLEDWYKIEAGLAFPTSLSATEKPRSIETAGSAVFQLFPSSMAASPEAEKLQSSLLKCLEVCYYCELQSQLPINISLDVREAEERSPFHPDLQVQFAAKLNAAFEEEPLEDGMIHSAEQIIEEALLSTEEPHIFEYLQAFCLDKAHPNFAASVLRCLGRRADLGTKPWQINLVRSALKMDDAEIRDAAVQAAESWESQDMRNILEAHAHHEPLQWLRKYVRDVVEDLGD